MLFSSVQTFCNQTFCNQISLKTPATGILSAIDVSTARRPKAVLRADRSLQSSSRPPSSRAFLVGYRKVYSVRCEADVVMTSRKPVLNSYRLASSSLNCFESTTLGGADQINSTPGILELQNWLIAEVGSSCAPALLPRAMAAEAAWKRVDIALMTCRAMDGGH